MAHLPRAETDRALAAGRTDGFITLIAGPRPVLGQVGGGRILGATIPTVSTSWWAEASRSSCSRPAWVVESHPAAAWRRISRPQRPRSGVPLGGGAIDPHQVLGVARDASTEEVRRAYRRLARQHHPDRDPGPLATERFRLINEAYRMLGDEPARAAYDATRTPADAATGDHQPTPRPAAQPSAPPLAGTNRLAAASILVCIAAVCVPGPLLFGWYLGPVGALMGHAARWQIRRSGEAGAGLAAAGIVAGWGMTLVAIAATTVAVLISRTQ